MLLIFFMCKFYLYNSLLIFLLIGEKINKFVFLHIPDENLGELIKLFEDRYQFIFQRQRHLQSTNSVVIAPQVSCTPGSKLKTLLKSTFNGQYILKQSNLLSCGNELATIVVEYILSLNKRLLITKQQYQFWADEISAVWSKEISTTWYHHRSGTNATSGKLYHRFCNQSKKVKSSVKKFLQEEKEDIDKLQQVENEKIASSFIAELAQTSLDDKERILLLWEKTHKYRTTDIESISSYFENYAQLKTPLVLQLLELDFKLSYPTIVANSLVKKWPVLHLKIIKLAKKIKTANKLLENLSGVPSDVIAWKVFAHLFKPVSMASGTKKPWKASRKEQADGFITWIDVSYEIKSILFKQFTDYLTILIN